MIRLRAARQIDLQAGVAEIKNAGAERIEPPAGHLGDETALDQRREQMMAGRDIEAGALGKFGQRRLAARLGDRLEQKQRAIDRLNAVALARRVRQRVTLDSRSGKNCCVHGFASLLRRQGNGTGVLSQEYFRHSEYDFHDLKSIFARDGWNADQSMGYGIRLGQPQLDFQGPAEHLAERDVHFLDAGGGVGGHDQQVIGIAGEIAATLSAEAPP